MQINNHSNSFGFLDIIHSNLSLTDNLFIVNKKALPLICHPDPDSELKRRGRGRIPLIFRRL